MLNKAVVCKILEKKSQPDMIILSEANKQVFMLEPADTGSHH